MTARLTAVRPSGVLVRCAEHATMRLSELRVEYLDRETKASVSFRVWSGLACKWAMDWAGDWLAVLSRRDDADGLKVECFRLKENAECTLWFTSHYGSWPDRVAVQAGVVVVAHRFAHDHNLSGCLFDADGAPVAADRAPLAIWRDDSGAVRSRKIVDRANFNTLAVAASDEPGIVAVLGQNTMRNGSLSVVVVDVHGTGADSLIACRSIDEGAFANYVPDSQHSDDPNVLTFVDRTTVVAGVMVHARGTFRRKVWVVGPRTEQGMPAVEPIRHPTAPDATFDPGDIEGPFVPLGDGAGVAAVSKVSGSDRLVDVWHLMVQPTGRVRPVCRYRCRAAPTLAADCAAMAAGLCVPQSALTLVLANHRRPRAAVPPAEIMEMVMMFISLSSALPGVRFWPPEPGPTTCSVA